MTEQEIRRLTPAFAAYLKTYRDCFGQERTLGHFDTYCHGLLSDLPRKSVEPIALARGTTVRTLQVFLKEGAWDHEQARDLFQQRVVRKLSQQPPDPLGTIGIIDETSAVKKGDQTPGVQRQYLGCCGKIENGIVTVHTAVAHGGFKALLDTELYVPESWATDRERCQAAGIPDTMGYRPKWHIALEQLARLQRNGFTFAWLTFDEGYGSKVPFLELLNVAKQQFVAEIPKSFAVQTSATHDTQRADEYLPSTRGKKWKRVRLRRQTVADQVWRVRSARVWTAGQWHRLVVAVNETTGEVKYFLSNAYRTSVRRLMRVAFRRWQVEHAFRVAKQEAGLMHYEGRHYLGLLRHQILVLLVLGFVAEQTERLRKKKSVGDVGASVPSLEPPVCAGVPTATRDDATETSERGNPIPSRT